jgi:predicted TIM-barrel fold metal-dependent hydrolase
MPTDMSPPGINCSYVEGVLDISEETRAKIGGLNAQRFYGLN